MLKKYFMFTSLVIVLFSINTAAQEDWKTYPYHQQGSVIDFPKDEGWHRQMPVEWWYTTAHVTGDSTGTEYSFMLTYFYYPPFSFDGFRIFNIANETTGEFFPETLPYLVRVRAEDHLNIKVFVIGGSQEEWITLRDQDNNLIPFQYHITAHSQYGEIDVWYDTVKRPLMVGGTGYLHLGENSQTYYYSQTLLTVRGNLTLNGVSESISGTAWIDRQYFEAMAPLAGEKYEWFSCQLSNGMDLNIWNIFTPDNRIPANERFRICSMYIDEETTETTSDFSLNRLQFVFTPDGERCYSRKWHFSYKDIDLTITTLFNDQEVVLPFHFYEGSTRIEGTVNGEAVEGVGFAELLHHYQPPRMQLIFPTAGTNWNGSQPFRWQMLNPDDGRPIYFDLELSTDNKASFRKLARALTDTSFLWSQIDVVNGSECWLRVVGYSIDSTLIGTDVMDSPFVLNVTSVQEPIQQAAVPQKLTAVVQPNPGYLQAHIQFELSVATQVTIRVYNILGQRLATLADNRRFAVGRHEITWPGRDDSGRPVASGVYLYRISTPLQVLDGRLVFLR